MKVLLIGIDSRIPNLALHKIAKYHRDRGDEVIWNMPLMRYTADKIYVSCVFSWNKDDCYEWEDVAEIGGTGYDLEKTLPEEIERVKPRINLGFTTRGCPRKCRFCIVPQKEKEMEVVGDLLDLWDGKSHYITVLDNNILAFPEHFGGICGQAIGYDFKVDFNQGLDICLLNEENAWLLVQLKPPYLRFSFDHINMMPDVEWGLKVLKQAGYPIDRHRLGFYVLIGYDSTYQDDLHRLDYLHNRNINTHVQIYNNRRDDEKLRHIARWGSRPGLWTQHKFEDYEPYKRMKAGAV